MVLQLNIFYLGFMRKEQMVKMKPDFVDFLMRGHCEPCWSQLPLALPNSKLNKEVDINKEDQLHLSETLL